MKDTTGWTKNEIIAFGLECSAQAINDIADFVEEHVRSRQELIDLLRECADEQYAQAVVVKLRDEINK